MKKVSFPQPYAELIFHYRMATHTWTTPYRGPVLVCVPQEPLYPEALKKLAGNQINHVHEIIGSRKFNYTYGMAIGVADLIHIRPMELSDEHLSFVDFRPELNCFIYKDMHRIKPFLIIGTSRLTPVPMDIQKKAFSSILP